MNDPPPRGMHLGFVQAEILQAAKDAVLRMTNRPRAAVEKAN